LDADDRPSVDFGGDALGNIWKETKETTRHHNYIDLSNLSKKLSTGSEQLLTYFLDGSRHVYKVDHMGYSASGTGNRSEIFPIIAGQIGVGCCKRNNKKLYTEKHICEIVISVPDKANADGNGRSGFFSALATKMTQHSVELKRLGIVISAILPYSTAKVENDKEYEDRATAKVQDRMIDKEKEAVAKLVKAGKLDQNNYLIKDGSLEYRPSKEDRADKRKLATFKNNYAWVLGASKHFNPAVCKDISGKPNPGFIAYLPLYHRTPVACFKNPELFGDMEFAVWYIRIRAKEKTRTPFDGILKIEKMLTTSDEQEYGIDSQLVDILSAYIINERNPVCYGSDLRWANHIYPMFLTESFVKSKYISTESFLQLF
jgi:hypothetical protein